MKLLNTVEYLLATQFSWVASASQKNQCHWLNMTWEAIATQKTWVVGATHDFE